MRRNAGPGGSCPPQLRRRAGSLAVASAGLVLLAVACGGSSPGGGADTFRGGTYKQALSYTTCMRRNGVADFPDPSPQGNFSSSQLQLIARSVPQARNANLQCRGLLPNGGFQGSATELQQDQARLMRQSLKYAQCMRTHGYPDFPDPNPGPGGYGVSFPVLPGVSQSSPQFHSANKACNGPR